MTGPTNANPHGVIHRGRHDLIRDKSHRLCSWKLKAGSRCSSLKGLDVKTYSQRKGGQWLLLWSTMGSVDTESSCNPGAILRAPKYDVEQASHCRYVSTLQSPSRIVTFLVARKKKSDSATPLGRRPDPPVRPTAMAPLASSPLHPHPWPGYTCYWAWASTAADMECLDRELSLPERAVTAKEGFGSCLVQRKGTMPRHAVLGLGIPAV